MLGIDTATTKYDYRHLPPILSMTKGGRWGTQTATHLTAGGTLLPARVGVVREGYTASYLASATHLTAGGTLLPARVGVVREGYRSIQLNMLLAGLGRGVMGIDTATTKYHFQCFTVCAHPSPPSAMQRFVGCFGVQAPCGPLPD